MWMMQAGPTLATPHLINLQTLRLLYQHATATGNPTANPSQGINPALATPDFQALAHLSDHLTKHDDNVVSSGKPWYGFEPNTTPRNYAHMPAWLVLARAHRIVDPHVHTADHKRLITLLSSSAIDAGAPGVARRLLAGVPDAAHAGPAGGVRASDVDPWAVLRVRADFAVAGDVAARGEAAGKLWGILRPALAHTVKLLKTGTASGGPADASRASGLGSAAEGFISMGRWLGHLPEDVNVPYISSGGCEELLRGCVTALPFEARPCPAVSCSNPSSFGILFMRLDFRELRCNSVASICMHVHCRL
jgi:hypothetical protein